MLVSSGAFDGTMMTVRAVSAVAERFARQRRSLGFPSQHGLSSTGKKSYTSLPPTNGNAD